MRLAQSINSAATISKGEATTKATRTVLYAASGRTDAGELGCAVPDSPNPRPFLRRRAVPLFASQVSRCRSRSRERGRGQAARTERVDPLWRLFRVGSDDSGAL